MRTSRVACICTLKTPFLLRSGLVPELNNERRFGSKCGINRRHAAFFFVFFFFLSWDVSHRIVSRPRQTTETTRADVLRSSRVIAPLSAHF